MHIWESSKIRFYGIPKRATSNRGLNFNKKAPKIQTLLISDVCQAKENIENVSGVANHIPFDLLCTENLTLIISSHNVQICAKLLTISYQHQAHICWFSSAEMAHNGHGHWWKNIGHWWENIGEKMI